MLVLLTSDMGNHMQYLKCRRVLVKSAGNVQCWREGVVALYFGLSLAMLWVY